MELHGGFQCPCQFSQRQVHRRLSASDTDALLLINIDTLKLVGFLKLQSVE